MTDKYPISLRLSCDKHALYEAEARARKLPLGTYLKQRLEKGDETIRAITNMQGSIELMQKKEEERQIVRGSASADDRDINQYRSMMLEILLLLRCTIQPHKVNMVQAEIQRQGLEAWNPKSWEGGDTDDR